MHQPITRLHACEFSSTSMYVIYEAVLFAPGLDRSSIKSVRIQKVLVVSAVSCW